MLRASATATTQRLTGIDAARGLALLGMMACHIFPLYEAGTPTFVGSTFSGRSAALFAVLAGLSLALYTGRNVPHRGESLSADRRGLAMRALVIAVAGFAVGVVETSIAIILVQYAVLFLAALPFAGLRLRALAIWAAGWLLISPVLAYLVRPVLQDALVQDRLGHNPVWSDLLTPGTFLADMFFTGYYPVAQWIGYILVGMAIGRLDLTRVPNQLVLLIGGAAVAILAKSLGNYFMYGLGGFAALVATGQESQAALEAMMQVSLTPVDQSGSWWWLAASAPHSGTTLDLLHTSAAAAAVIGLCLLLTHRNRSLLLPLSGAGAMTLTLYTAHIIALALIPDGETALEPAVLYWIFALATALLGTVYTLLTWRGPLESMTSTLARGARGR